MGESCPVPEVFSLYLIREFCIVDFASLNAYNGFCVSFVQLSEEAALITATSGLLTALARLKPIRGDKHRARLKEIYVKSKNVSETQERNGI